MHTISFVIPIYNEAKRFKKTAKALQSLKLPKGVKLSEVIFVNDGSTDASRLLIRNFIAQNKHTYTIKLINYFKNKGKGYAIRAGMQEATADYALFFDADMSTPLTELSKFVPLMEKRIDVIVGTRRNGESTVIKHQPLLREFLGRCFTHMARTALNIQVTDFTCGFKAFSKSARLTIFPQSKINGWGYDVELLFLTQLEKLSVAEQAVLWSNDENSKVRLYKAIPQTLLDLARIHWYHSLKPFAKNARLLYGYRVLFPKHA